MTKVKRRYCPFCKEKVVTTKIENGYLCSRCGRTWVARFELGKREEIDD